LYGANGRKNNKLETVALQILPTLKKRLDDVENGMKGYEGQYLFVSFWDSDLQKISFTFSSSCYPVIMFHFFSPSGLPDYCASYVCFYFYFIFAALDLLTEMKEDRGLRFVNCSIPRCLSPFRPEISEGYSLGVNCQFTEGSASKGGDGHLVCPLQIRRCSVARQTSFSPRIELLR